MRQKITLTLLVLAAFAGMAKAQTAAPSLSLADVPEDSLAGGPADSLAAEPVQYLSVCDSLLQAFPVTEQVVDFQPLPYSFFMPIVFTSYEFPKAPEDVKPVFSSDYSDTEAFRWAESDAALHNRISNIQQHVFISSPTTVKYNQSMLPEPPKQFTAIVDPKEHTIEIKEIGGIVATTTITAEEVKKIHWINTFDASLQFSQAYVSPNWYQGGNNNLNVLLNLFYNIKLNQAYHPNLLFETTAQYRLGLNSAPDDTLRAYNISEDLFQVNTTFGLKAAHRWYYTVNAQFKTQLLNSYKSNTTTLRSAFLSPGELNVGVGMTYNTENKKKTFRFDASLSPLSYNLMICTNSRLDETSYGIKAGQKTVSKFGSSMECKLMWKLTDNITLNSRLFGFTDYSRAYCDLENTLVFQINKYLTTQIFAHLRYDTHTPVNDPEWHKLQLKEIISVGFAYKFTTH